MEHGPTEFNGDNENCGRVKVSPVKKKKKGTLLVEINENLCKGCDICIVFCPTDVFEKSDKLNRKGYYVPVVAKMEECNGCRICELLCPDFAIVVTEQPIPAGTPTGENDGE